MKSLMEDMHHEENLLLDKLYSDNVAERNSSIRMIRNTIIGMKSRKSAFVSAGLIDKLLELMVVEHTSVEFGVEAAIILGSVARGNPDDVQVLLNSNAIPILCKGICHHDERLVLACLRSLHICFLSNQVPSDLIFEDVNLISKLVQLLTKSSLAAEYAASILKKSCQSASDQSMLCEVGIIPALVNWLTSKQSALLVPILGCLSVLVSGNEIVAEKLFESTISDLNVKQLLTKLISRDKDEEVQLEAAICLSKILRTRAQADNNNLLEKKLLNVFIDLCVASKNIKLRINAALGMAYLIEDDSELQSIAAVSNHLIRNIGFYFQTEKEEDPCAIENLREGAFKVLACLSANDEKIRKRVVDETPKLTVYIHEAVNQDTNIALQTAALQCLLSLSRSVQQLRTTFQDRMLWEPVIIALKSSTSDDVISVASSVLCNLLLDFSPCKEALVEYGALDVLMKLIKRNEVPFRVNGVWGLMNLAYDADDCLKDKIVDVVTIKEILKLLDDGNVDVAVKALGILRNLLTEKEQDIDNLMESHGNDIMISIKPLVLNQQLSEKLREQVLCLLSNIANGLRSKEFLMQDDELLLTVIGLLTSSSEQLQVASVFCITNLMRGGDDTDNNRLEKLQALGTDKQLKLSQDTVNANLCERIKIALDRFT